jgi:hypothetical protein
MWFQYVMKTFLQKCSPLGEGESENEDFLFKILRFLSKSGGTEIFGSSAAEDDPEAVSNIRQNRQLRVAENSAYEFMSHKMQILGKTRCPHSR